MSKKTNAAAPIEPGKPKKDNTVLIIVVSSIIFFGLPILLVIALLCFSFGMVNKIIKIAMNHAHDLPYAISLEENNVSGTAAQAFENVYLNLNSPNSLYGYVPSEKIAKKRCRSLEYFIEDETDSSIDICDDWGFKAYAYSENNYRIVELYGIDYDSDRYVKIILSEDFSKSYSVVIDNVAKGHNASAQILKYSDMKVLLLPTGTEPVNAD